MVVCTMNLSDDAAASKPVFDWIHAELQPMLSKYNDFLRSRYLKVTHADLTANGSQVQRETNSNALAIFEVNGDDWIWEVMLDANESPDFRKLEKGLVCSISPVLRMHEN